MDIEQRTPAQSGQSPDDEMRLNAATRRVVIQPLSPAVTADELTDSEVATDHLNNPAVANVPIDTERTLPTPVTPPTSKSHSSRSKLIWIAGAAIVIVGGGIYLLGSGLL